MKLLIDEPPLQVLPSLAEAIGINEAIVLQQVHYWLQKQGKEQDGRLWTYNSYSNWQKQFPFWSESSIKRTFQSLEKKGLLISGNFNKLAMDKTKWYTINYSRLDEIDRRSGQLDPTMRSNCTDDEVNLTQPIPETISKTNSDIDNDHSKNDRYPDPKFNEFWEAYPRKIAKQEAWSKWKTRMREKVNPDDLITAAKNYALTTKGTEQRYIKHAATFLGPDHHYEDYIQGIPEQNSARKVDKPEPKPQIAW